MFAGVAADIVAGGAAAKAQPPAVADAAAAAQLPEPIFWKQELLFIPYQGNTLPDGGAGQAVWLFISKDRGASWQKISEAQPHVKAFNYRTEGEGEYWFAMRTIDAAGRAWPEGPYAPELRVLVDTTAPRIEVLQGVLRSDGALEVEWRADDAHLDAASWKIEIQAEGMNTWEEVAVTAPSASETGPAAGKGAWFPPPGQRPAAVRATVFDLAGNSAVAQAEVTTAPYGGPDRVAAAAPPPPPRSNESGWSSVSAATDAAPLEPTPPTNPLAVQPWPATEPTRSPYRLSDHASQRALDGVTRYGNPVGVGVSNGPSEVDEFSDDSAAPPSFSPLEPFRQASLRRLPPTEAGSKEPRAGSNEPEDWIEQENRRTEGQQTSQRLAASKIRRGGTRSGARIEPAWNIEEAKWVASRTFELDYELQDVGRWGVSRVELWGTRDGGESWRHFAEDDDLRSPLRITVQEAGLYGFRILAESAGAPPALPPQPGEPPELVVGVDLQRPVAELTAVEPGSGNQADHLLISWRAEDDHLGPQPIALFYSSRPAGPWSVIAARLENTGQYAWRIERHLPRRCYLRLEVRDLAGNLAAFQTLEPVVLEARGASARLRSVTPAGPTAAIAEPPRR